MFCAIFWVTLCAYSQRTKSYDRKRLRSASPRWIHCFFGSSPLPDVMSGSFETLRMRSKAYVLCYFLGDFVCLFSKDKKLQAETSGEGTNPRWIHCFFASSPLPDVMSGSFETLLLTNLGRSLVTAVRFPHVVLVFYWVFMAFLLFGT